MRHFIMMSVIIGLLLALRAFGVGAAVGQDSAATCPPAALLSMARAASACMNMARGEACYGSGGVVAAAASYYSPLEAFAQPGDRMSIREINSLSTHNLEGDEVGMAFLSIPITPDANSTLYAALVGGIQIINITPPRLELPAFAVGVLNVRAAPDDDAEVIVTLAVNQGVTVTGRGEGDWLRISVPATGAVGWVQSSLLTVQGNVGELEIAVPGELVLQPFQHFNLMSNDVEDTCGGALPNGILLQTPASVVDTAVNFYIDRIPLQLAGTAFIRGATLIVLEGGATVRETQIVPAGAMLDLRFGSTTPMPYDPALTAALPINGLPHRVRVVDPLPEAEIAAAGERWLTATGRPPSRVVIPPTPDPDRCQRIAARQTQVYAGPGDNFEILRTIDAGTPLSPTLLTNDSDGSPWWQLADSAWIDLRDTSERGRCDDVPFVVRVPPPRSNTYSLERCESFNGPVRVGQRVTITFTPPPWNSYAEAVEALRTDPGRMTINNDSYRPTVSDPIRVNAVTDPLESRYRREFTFAWTAVAGTFRITGDWLHYEPRCSLTVAVE
jgi:uncharacterized protein YraI